MPKIGKKKKIVKEKDTHAFHPRLLVCSMKLKFLGKDVNVDRISGHMSIMVIQHVNLSDGGLE